MFSVVGTEGEACSPQPNTPKCQTLTPPTLSSARSEPEALRLSLRVLAAARLCQELAETGNLVEAAGVGALVCIMALSLDIKSFTGLWSECSCRMATEFYKGHKRALARVR